MLRERAVAQIVLKRFTKAIEDLKQASQGSKDASFWSDLAAAFDGDAMSNRCPAQLRFALAAIDHALKLDPNLAAARFNRALILEHLGDLSSAERAWQTYLHIEPYSDWANEARLHIRRHDVHQTPDFGRSIRTAADSSIAQLTANAPQDARSWGEGPLLAEWAAANLADDREKASRVLHVVRTIGNVLCRTRRECLLSDSVAVIDTTTSDRSRSMDLAKAHRLYDEGRKKYSRRSPAEAERDLQDAAELFASAGSPMADVATYFAANAVFDQNRTAEAKALLAALIDRVDRTRHQALHAQQLWQLARCDIVDGVWSAALTKCNASRQIFAALGEQRNEARVTALAADACEYVNASEKAWALRIEALQMLSRSGSDIEARSVLANATRGAIRMGEPAVALALTELSIEHLRIANDALQLADVYVQRARIAAALPDMAQTQEALRTAEAAIMSISDRALRARSAADLLLVKGLFLRSRDPHASIKAFSRAIDFYRTHGYAFWLIDAYLQRGRAYAAIRQSEQALNDFLAGIDELEKERSNVEEQQRPFFFDREPALVEETVQLLLDRNETGRAFEIAERGRARTLGEHLTAAVPGTSRPSLAAVQSALPPRTALLEYVFTRNGAVRFGITNDSVTVEPLTIGRDKIQTLIASHRRAVQSDAPAGEVKRLGMAAHSALIASAGVVLTGIDEIVFVGDRDFEAVVWPALYDRRSGRFLIQDVAMSVAPSAAVYVALKYRMLDGTAVFVGNPAAPGYDNLTHAETEAISLARLHRASRVLLGPNATRSAFARAAGASSLVHVASHARSDDGQPPAILFAPDGKDDGALGAGDIAQLHLPKTAIVILAACGTARGRTTHVEGIQSLGRAFLSTGVPTVIATRWDIDDLGATVLFGEFHRRLAAGEGPTRALQLARVAKIQSLKPSTWAAVEVLGKGTLPVVKRKGGD